MILCIDSGNTSIKAGLFDHKGEIHKQINIPTYAFDYSLFNEFDIQGVCISDVGKAKVWHIPQNVRLIEISNQLKFPFSIEYKTPLTLGADRLALVAGTIKMFPNENVLIIDSGTCVTYDLLSAEGVYKGGVISPGIEMRLKAMHTFTGKLPLLEPDSAPPFLGDSTASCMQSGAINGLALEIGGFIDRFRSEFIGLKTIITGGNAQLLAKQIHNAIFAEPNLLLNGLYHLYKINVG